MKYYIKIDGGIGRCITATGAVREYAKDKKVYVVTPYDFIFDGLENIERSLVIGTKGIEEEILTGVYTEPEPYNDFSYYREEKHLCQVFNKILNNKDEYIAPVMNLTNNELLEAKLFVQQQKNSIKNGLVLIQPWSSSGGMPVSNEEINCDESYRSFTLPVFNTLCEKLLESGFMPFIVKLPQQAGHPKCLTFNNAISPRRIMALIPYVNGIISCDSFLHHASASLGSPVPTVVFWGGTSHKNLGYENQTNICGRTPIVEPMRIPHDHSYYLTKNKGCNEWTDKDIELAIDKMINV
jgi:hypothetical protein